MSEPGRMRPTGRLLGAWFIAWTVVHVAMGGATTALADGAIYIGAGQALLAGLNPWDHSVMGLHFAAPPPALAFVVPFAVAGLWSWVGATLVAAVYLLRRLGLGPWWLMFPPLVHGLVNMNPIIIAMALVLSPVAWLAPLARMQMLVPLLASPRALALALLVLAVTLPAWGDFLAALPGIAARYTSESTSSGFWPIPLSGWGTPIWFIGAAGILILLVVDRRAALWLIVPTLAPTAGLYDAVLALPVGHAPTLAAFAVHVPGGPAFGVVLLAIVRTREWRAARILRESPPAA